MPLVGQLFSNHGGAIPQEKLERIFEQLRYFK